MKILNKHNRELSISRIERKYIHIKVMPWLKRNAHKETRRNGRAIIESELRVSS